MARLLLPITVTLSGHQSQIGLSLIRSGAYQQTNRLHQTSAPSREAMAPMREALAPTRKTLAPMRKALAPTRGPLAPMREALAPMRGALAPTRGPLAPTRGPLAPYVMRWYNTLAPTGVEYTQGQSPQHRIREYFYYIDHQGMLFLDDARIKNFTSCFKDKKFLAFLMSRVCVNETGRYPHFPFLSLCGRERNYIRCDDLPYVFTHVIEGKTEGEEGQYYLTYNHAGNALTMPFQPSEICMEVGTGRVYHPAPPRVGGVGLLRSKLAIQLAPHFLFHGDDDQLPSHIVWDGAEVKLQHSLVHTLTKLQHLRQYSLGLNGTLPN